MKIKYPIHHIFFWKPMLISFHQIESRKLLNDFLEDENIYLDAVANLDEAIDLNQVVEDEKICEKIYNSFKPDDKFKFIEFLKS